jgi:hypothetical protein
MLISRSALITNPLCPYVSSTVGSFKVDLSSLGSSESEKSFDSVDHDTSMVPHPPTICTFS